MPNLILASTSPRRLSLLQQIGYNPHAVFSPEIDETPLKNEDARSLVQRLSSEKAKKAYEVYPNDIIIAGDTVVSRGRRIIGKPDNEEAARASLKFLSGHRHRVYTGVSVIYNNIIKTKVSYSIVKFKRLSEEEIALYLKSNEWRDKAGAYSLQGLANIFIEKIIGSDSNILGLNLNITYKLLSFFGFPK